MPDATLSFSTQRASRSPPPPPPMPGHQQPQHASKLANVLSRTAKNGRERSAQRLAPDLSTGSNTAATSVSMDKPYPNSRRSWTVINHHQNQNHDSNSSSTTSSVDSGLSHHSITQSSKPAAVLMNGLASDGEIFHKNDLNSSSPHFGVIFRSYDQRTFTEKQTFTTSPNSGTQQIVTETRSVQRAKPVEYAIGDNLNHGRRATAEQEMEMKPLYISAKVQPISYAMPTHVQQQGSSSPPALRYTSTFSLVRTPPKQQKATSDQLSASNFPKTKVTEEVETVETAVRRIPMLPRNGPLTSSGRRPKHYLNRSSAAAYTDASAFVGLNARPVLSSSSDEENHEHDRSMHFRRSRRRRVPENQLSTSALNNFSTTSQVNADADEVGTRSIQVSTENGLHLRNSNNLAAHENPRAILLSASSTYISKTNDLKKVGETSTYNSPADVSRSNVNVSIRRPQGSKDDEEEKVAAGNEEFFFSDNEADQDAKFGLSKRNNSIRSKVGIFRSTQQLSPSDPPQQSILWSSNGNGGNMSRRTSFNAGSSRLFNSNLVSQRVQHYSNLSASQRALIQAESTPPVSLQTRPLHHKLRSQSIGQLPLWPPPAPSAVRSTTFRNVESSVLANLNQVGRRSSSSKIMSREPTPVDSRQQSAKHMQNAHEHADFTPSPATTKISQYNSLPKSEKLLFEVGGKTSLRSQSSVTPGTAAERTQKTVDAVKPVPAVRQREILATKPETTKPIMQTGSSINILQPVPSAALKQRQQAFEASSSTTRTANRLTDTQKHSNTPPLTAGRNNSERQQQFSPTQKRTSLTSGHSNVVQSAAQSTNLNSRPHGVSTVNDRTANGYAVVTARTRQTPTTVASLHITAADDDVSDVEEQKPAKVMVNHRSIAPVAADGQKLHHEDEVILPAPNDFPLLPRRRDSIDSGKSSSSNSGDYSTTTGSQPRNALKTTTIVSGSDKNQLTGIDISDVNSRMSLLLTSLTQIRAQLINQPSIECELVALQHATKQQAQLAAVLQRKSEVVATIRREASQALLLSHNSETDWRYKTLSLKLEELDRLWRAVGQYLRRREATIVVLIGRVQEFDDAADACDLLLKKYEEQLSAYDALSDSERRDSNKHAETIKQLQDRVESMRRQIDVVKEMSMNIELTPQNGKIGDDDDDEVYFDSTTVSSSSKTAMPRNLPVFNGTRVQQAAFELRERHEHVLLELAQRLAVLDVASTAVKQFDIACTALQRHLDTKDDELDDIEANDVVARDRDVIMHQVDEIREFLREIERCENQDFEKLRRMIEDIVARGYSTTSGQLQLHVDKLSKQLSKLKDRAHARTEDVELMLDKLKNFHDDVATLMSLIDGEREKVLKKVESLGVEGQQRKSSTSSSDSGAENSDEDFKLFLTEKFEPIQAKFRRIRNTGQRFFATTPPGVSTSSLQFDMDKLQHTWQKFNDAVEQWQQTVQSNRLAHEKWHDECDDVANKIVELELAVAAARPPVLDTAVLEEQLHGQQFFERMADAARAAFESLCQLTAEIPDFSTSALTASQNSSLELEKRLSVVDEQIELRRKLLGSTLPLVKNIYANQLPTFREVLANARRQIEEFIELGQQNGAKLIDAHTQLHQKLIIDVQAPLNAMKNSLTQLEDLFDEQNASQTPVKVDFSTPRSLIDECQNLYQQLLTESESVLSRIESERQTVTTFDADCDTLLQWLNALDEKVHLALTNVPTLFAVDENGKQQPNYEVLLSLIRDDLEDSRKLLEHVNVQLHDMQKDEKPIDQNCRSNIDLGRQLYAKLSHSVGSQLAAAAEMQTLTSELREVHQTLLHWFGRANDILQEEASQRENANEEQKSDEKLLALQRDATDALGAVEAMRATFARLQEVATVVYSLNPEVDNKSSSFFDVLLQLIADDEKKIHVVTNTASGKKLLPADV